MSTTGQRERGELLERSGELDAIRAGAESVAAGEGRVLVVEGPAGIGKTALIAAARALISIPRLGVRLGSLAPPREARHRPIG